MKKYGREHETLRGNFCSKLPIMHGVDSYLTRSKYRLTIKNLVCTHFYVPPIFGV